MPDAALLDERALSKLRWRCRRGLLETDLLIERFFATHAAALTVGQGRALGELMELADNDLLDLLLRRKDLQAGAALETRQVLELLRPQRAPAPEESENREEVS